MAYSDRELEKRDRARTKKQEMHRKRRENTSQDGIADWTGADGDALKAAIAAISAIGGALRLGYTRDGGAYAIGIYGDGDPFTEYVSPRDDIDEHLRGIADDYKKS